MAVVAIVATLSCSACAPNEANVCSSTTENTAPSCAANYNLCAGGTDRIECKPPAGGGGVTCACIENGVTKKSFPSDDACNVGVDTLKMRAADSCGWMLDETTGSK